MHWSDDGIVLSARKHGETSVIVSLLTREHGRHAGLVRGGAGRRARGVYQPGNLVTATWHARLAEHLGTFRCELARAYAAPLLSERLPLLALQSATSLLDSALAEREPQPALFANLERLLTALAEPDWMTAYVRWELALLSELGFGLDLETCAATGAKDDLVYVSPRTGRAVSAAAGEPYRRRLLALPVFLTSADATADDPRQISAGLALTGYFLAGHVFAAEDRKVPDTRMRLVDVIAQLHTISRVF